MRRALSNQMHGFLSVEDEDPVDEKGDGLLDGEEIVGDEKGNKPLPWKKNRKSWLW